MDPKWGGSEVEVAWKSKRRKRHEFQVRSKWHSRDTEGKSRWHRTDIELKSKIIRSRIEGVSKWNRNDVEVSSKCNWNDVELASKWDHRHSERNRSNVGMKSKWSPIVEFRSKWTRSQIDGHRHEHARISEEIRRKFTFDSKAIRCEIEVDPKWDRGTSKQHRSNIEVK